MEAPDEEIETLTEHISGRRYQEMFSGWNNYDVQETRRVAREEGRNEGRVEGRRETAIRFLQEGLSVELVARASQLTVEDVLKLKDGASLVSEDAPPYGQG